MDPLTITSVLLILLISVIIHEVMHGLAALYFGDHTAENAGRLTLNPLPHIDPIGSILLPLAAFAFGTPILAWAKPVPVNPMHFSNIRLGEFVVAIAGVAANLAIAIVAAVLFHATTNFYYPYWVNILSEIVTINLSLAVFNLMPIPPLDGSRIVASLLPAHLEYEYRKLEQYGFLILIVLMMSPLKGIFFGIIGLILAFLHSLLGV